MAEAVPEPEPEVVVYCGEFKVRLKIKGPINSVAVKREIQKIFGIEVARQILGAGPDCDVPDETCVFESDTVFFLTVKPSSDPHAKLYITVKHSASDYEQDFEVKETDTVMSLKEKIQASSKFNDMVIAKKIIDIETPDLVLMRTEGLEMSKVDLPLSEYYIHDGCKIMLHIL